MKPLLPAILALSTVAAATADGIELFCIAEGGTRAVCDCSAHALTGEAGADDFALHHRIVTDSRRLGASGAALPFDAAVAAEAERSGIPADMVRRRAEAMARAHRALIRQCAG